MGRARTLSALAAIVATAPIASPAAAEEETYTLSWVRAAGAESCPSGRVLRAEVERRLGRTAFDDGAERSFEIVIERSDAGFRSEIHIRTVDGRALGVRELTSNEPDCTDVFHATALAVALAIDPDARVDDGPVPVASFSELPPREHPTITEPQPTPAPIAQQPVASTEDVPVARGQPAIAAPELPSVRVAGGLAVTVAVLPAPTGGYGIVSSGEVAPSWGWEAGVLDFGSAEHATTGGVVALVGLTGGWVGPRYVPVQGRVARLALGVDVMAGRLHVAVRNPEPRDVGGFAHVAARAGARLDLRIAGPLLVELGWGGLVPLTRHRLNVVTGGDPEATWDMPPVGVVATVGLGLVAP